MLEYLLDTHALLWWQLEPERLPKRQLDVLERVTAAKPIAISGITLWELAMLVAKSRVVLPIAADAWLGQLERNRRVSVLPITASIAVASTQLGPDFHADPADRIIVATARVHGLTLITSDDPIRKWGKVHVV